MHKSLVEVTSRGWARASVGTLVVLAAVPALSLGCGVTLDALPGETAVYAVEMDGKVVGSVTDFSVDADPASPNRPRPVAFRLDTLSGPELMAWVREELNADGADAADDANRHAVAVVRLDPVGTELGRIDLGLAHVQEITFPQVRADGRDDLAVVLRLHGDKLEETDAVRPPTVDSALVAGARQGVGGQDRTKGGLIPSARFGLSVELPGDGGSAWTCATARDPVCSTLSFTLHRERQPDATTTKMHGATAAPGAWKPSRVSVSRDWTGDTTLLAWADQGVEAQRRVVRIAFRDDDGKPRFGLVLAGTYLLSWSGPPEGDRHAVHVNEEVTLVYDRLTWQ